MQLRTRLSLLVTLALLAPATADARDFTITSFDGTSIVAHFHPAGAEKAPTVLVGPGWGNPGWTDPEQPSDRPNGLIGVAPLRRAGYNVLTWDPRGFGASGGEAKLDSPHFEARDVQKLIDALALLPEAKLDSAGDPRVGMAGASYGGGIQWVTAAIDQRVDAITPDIAWHSLEAALARDGLFKGGWGNFLCGVGVANGVSAGLINPAGIQAGSVDGHFYSVCQNGLATGSVRADDRAWLLDRGPGQEWTGRVKAPALVIHSMVDTLFTPSEAIANYGVLHARGVPTRMMWFCGGHGACVTPAGTPGYVEAAVLRWFARYLKGDESVETGPGFEWVDQDGRWRAADEYPLDAEGQLSAAGSGTLNLVTADPNTSGSTVAASPAREGVKLDLPAHGRTSNLVGEPVLEIDYTGTGTGGATHVFAQLVDLDRNLVLGGQVTPIPLTLDGKQHTVKRTLEGLAYRVGPASRLQLQVIASTNVYGQQRSTGSVNLSRVSATFPLGKARSSGGKGCRPVFSPRTVKLGLLRRVRLRPRIRCGGRKLTLPVELRAGTKRLTVQTGRLAKLRVPRGTRKLVARYTYGGRLRKVNIALER